jgi:NAD-dependent dihydropyrimidine dehydrogenase PreA subunit
MPPSQGIRSYILTSIILIVAVIILALLIKYPPYKKQQPIAIKDNMTLRHIAERNDVPLHTLISLLNSEDRKDIVTTFKNIHTPLHKQNIDKDRIRSAVLEARAGGIPTKDIIRFLLWSIAIAIAGLLLFRKKGILGIRRLWMVVGFSVFGIILGASPNPMEATVRFHKLIKGIPGNPLIVVALTFATVTLLSLLGARMLCSWGCPLGALQESLHNIPVWRQFKTHHKLSFAASIAVRITFYLVFVLLLFRILNINQGGPGSILYHHVNLFKIFDPYELAQFTLLLIPIFMIASLLFFRPFCHTLCPFGFWAWVFEKAALYKVRKVNPEACVDCRKCEEACPTEAMKAINANKHGFWKPDCWSCGNCLVACSYEALEFARTARHVTERERTNPSPSEKIPGS